ncbi:tissue factor pathway inhibitor-like [Leguminivora glycinivorella]|uniref:tissue factor pathway inhibitor-like n=1 Tax=Leguminivora glycinivorella TaxID=1035111 RepID=UPI00201012A3|nr:tissue factor pathway inhibitor-like [Leguminivora glycinivorella]
MSALCLSILITVANLIYVRSDDPIAKPEGNSSSPSVYVAVISNDKKTTTTEVTLYPPLSVFGFDVQCKFQPDSYECSKPHRFINRWYFDTKMEDCKSFKWFRCKSNNQNNFATYGECREFCQDPGPHPIEDVLPENAACHLQPDFGDCQDYIPMFYYDISNKRCFGFSFSGCGGNQNRFYSDKTCSTVCNEAIENTPK